MTVTALDMTLELLGDEMKAAILAARERTSDATITARCAQALWDVERNGAPIAHGLSYEDALTAIGAIA